MFVRLLPAIFSTIIMAAHLSRAGFDAVAIAVLVLPVTFLVRHPLLPRIWQIFLALTGLAWIYITAGFVQLRIEAGAPWVRLIIILGLVVLFNFYAAWSMGNKKIRDFYQSDRK